MALYFFRHAEAFDIGQEGIRTDTERHLTPKGQKVTVEVCEALRTLEVKGGLLWHSPLVRAKQTAEIILRNLDIKKAEEKDGLAYEEDEEDLFQSLLSLPRDTDLFLVGHQPSLGEWIARLIAGGPPVGGVEIAKSGVARVDLYPGGPAPRGELRWLMTAKQLRRLR
jgi:phosphohistidine phosphatase